MVGIKQRIKASPILVLTHLSYTNALLFASLFVKGPVFVLAMEPGPKGHTGALWLAHICAPGSRCTNIQEAAVKNRWSNNLLPFSAKTQNVYSLPF